MFWSLYRSTTFPSSYPSGKPTFTLLGGSASTFGKRKRSVPRVIKPREAAMVVQAKANQLPTIAKRTPRRSSTLGLAGGRGGAGFGGGAGGAPVATVVPVAPGASTGEVGGAGVEAGVFVTPGLWGVGSDMIKSVTPERRTGPGEKGAAAGSL